MERLAEQSAEASLPMMLSLWSSEAKRSREAEREGIFAGR